MENSKIYSKVFMWLFIGLAITFIGGYALSLNEAIYQPLLKVGIIPIIVVELVIAIGMGFGIQKMSPLVAKICYIVFCITTGITFSSIFIEYKLESIMLVFLITAFIFAALAVIGFVTKKDISRFGPILLVTLLASIVLGIVNIFLHNSMLELGLSILMLLIFMGYVIYDMKVVRNMIDTMDEDKVAVYGAFQLYLDFINIFIRLLEFFGKKND